MEIHSRIAVPALFVDLSCYLVWTCGPHLLATTGWSDSSWWLSEIAALRNEVDDPGCDYQSVRIALISVPHLPIPIHSQKKKKERFIYDVQTCDISLMTVRLGTSGMLMATVAAELEERLQTVAADFKTPSCSVTRRRSFKIFGKYSLTCFLHINTIITFLVKERGLLAVSDLLSFWTIFIRYSIPYTFGARLIAGSLCLL